MKCRLILLYFVVITNLFSAERWIRLTSGNLDLLTDTNPAAARRILRRFEFARAVLGQRDPSPVHVLALARDRDFQALRPSSSASGFYQSGPDGDYIVMPAADPEAFRVVLHEYTHLVLSHGVVLPQWLEEGLAEFYSTLQHSGGKIRIGDPIRVHLARLASATWLSASELASHKAGNDALFYAESWALSHMLVAGPQYRGRLDVFSAALGRGDLPATAFHTAFGKTLDDALTDLRQYVALPLPAVEIDPPAKLESAEATAAPVPEAEAVEVQADVLLLMDRYDEARTLFGRLLERYPDSPQAHTGLATLALRDHDYASARAHFAKALSAGTPTGNMLFEYAMLLRDTGASRDEVTAWIEKAVAATPSLAEAHFLLGVRASEDGRYADAAEHLRRAADILPRQAYFWHALAYAYYKLGDLGRCRDAALRARNAAKSEQEAAMAEAAVRLSIPGAPMAPPQPPVTTPATWDNPHGDTRAEGYLTQVDCGAPLRLHVGDLVLEVTDPTRVVLKGARGVSAELRCGPQNMAVAVEYDSATRQATQIEFR